MDKLLENHQFATHAIAASASVSLGTALAYPLDTIKTIIQVGSGPNKKLSSFQVVNRVLRFSGYSGLYSGLGSLTLGRISGVGARFGVYEILTAFYKDGRHDNYVSVGEAFLAGMVGGAAETVMTSPFELIKVRKQVTAASRAPNATAVAETAPVSPMLTKLLRRYTLDVKSLTQTVSLLSVLNHKHPNMTAALQEYPWMMTGTGNPPSAMDVKRPLDVASLEGYRALWRNLRSGLVRDCIYGGVFFSTWQFLHEAMVGWKAVGMNPLPSSEEEIGPLSPVAISVAAGFSGAIAAAASHSFDTARTRAQCVILPKYTAKERKFLRWNKPGKRLERWTGIHPTDRNLLFRGIGIRMARSSVASTVIVGSYYLAVDLLVPK
ncbi:Mitochondrial carrier domain superfamily [Arabidopsis thaliana x Arabidopsis arenosa]|uniref:Mitochondrial carrier domain superfamily n=1 Tax=Arabidopsis thaliana x Arabidopsis arenosa TaxID=1240361 RepID=A0A8T1YB62_9BRAS|nr:Mitochondrial carrier domain superfamily [Arabidopsis thaliana x Arabidopsis arenosa]